MLEQGPEAGSTRRTEIPTDLADRVRRYAQLRCAQRALFPLRPISRELPGEEGLQEIRERLLKVRVCSLSSGNSRDVALIELDSSINHTSQELRSALEQISFSELRATLPDVRATRSHEVEALLNLCLEEEPPGAHALRVIEYLTTLLSTDPGSGGRTLSTDPVSVTESMRQVCQRFSDSDPAEVQRHVEIFEEGMAQLTRDTVLDPLMRSMRDKKELMGAQILVPEVLRKAIAYNVAVTSRLHGVLESERTLCDLDIEALIDSDLEWGETLDDESLPSQLTHEELSGDPVSEIAGAFALLVRGDKPSDDPPGAIAQKLDPSVLNSAERRPFLGEVDDADTDLLRTVIVTGLLVSGPDEILEEAALTRAQLELERVPELDGRLQNLIAGKLKENEYGEAKILSQIRTRFLHTILEQQAAVRARDSAEPIDVPSELPPEWSEPTEEAPPATRRRTPVAERSKTRLAIRIASGLAIACGLMVGALQLYAPDNLRSTRRLSANELATISPYLSWAYRDGVGHGSNLVGMLGPEWHGLTSSIKREEAQAITDGLRTEGIEQIMLFDTSQALRVHAVGGQLRVPVPEAR